MPSRVSNNLNPLRAHSPSLSLYGLTLHHNIQDGVIEIDLSDFMMTIKWAIAIAVLILSALATVFHMYRATQAKVKNHAQRADKQERCG